ncbi:serine hydrolase domain-containing protein [Massilia horti]|uniref:Class C beta-lactamase-related serine hydrolase n=1 Tax=Massilia horti TaxID=2562153 RepID=A0A4Y9SR14_9BURK|nr:serine hydrolase [Massilia horti]TFW27789.1 class C beta-lactamase-related serine hydrolase [Massilia horti]
MKQGRRTMLGLALLGTINPLLAAPKRPAAASPLPPGVARQLDAELAAIAADPACQLASLSVLAIRNGKICYEQQFGQRVIGQDGAPGKPVDRNTLFRIASISKMMTTLGLMRLVEDGKLNLDADVSDYLGFTLRNPHFPERPITLRTLLTHRSSLRDDAGYSYPAATALKDVLVPGSRLYGEGGMWAANAGPGDYFTYCNLGWGVIGTVMERVTGERFDRLMKRLLLDPLGLQGGYNPADLPPPVLANVATLYRKRTTDTEIWDPNGPWIAQADDYSNKPVQQPPGIENYVIGANATPFSPTGGLRISAHDMGVIMLMMMNGGVHNGRRVLKQATLDQMFTRQWTYDGTGGNGDSLDGLFNCWGLGNEQFPDDPSNGTRIVEGGGFAAVGHLGDAYGLMSVFAADLKNRNGMIALVGGTSTDPQAYKGKYSALARFQEQILTGMYRRAILMQKA